MKTKRMTKGQAVAAFLREQYVERDGRECPFFAGVWGIFGHGNVAGLGQALHQNPRLPYYLCRNEQAMVHTAVAFAKMRNRLSTFACTTSIGPGATNMITGRPAPPSIGCRFCFCPATFSRGETSRPSCSNWNPRARRISRSTMRSSRCRVTGTASIGPISFRSALAAAMRVLTSPAQTGAVTLALPQDVQTEAWDYPEALFEKRVWHIPRPLADRALLKQAVEWIRAARRPLIVAGGGVHYAEAWRRARGLCARKQGLRLARRRPARARCPTIIRSNSAPSV